MPRNWCAASAPWTAISLSKATAARTCVTPVPSSTTRPPSGRHDLAGRWGAWWKSGGCCGGPRNTSIAQKPDLQICVDSPAMNFHFARAAPRAWHSRALLHRPAIVGLGREADEQTPPLGGPCGMHSPFEEQYFRGHGVNATFVGHPLFDQLPQDRGPDASAKYPHRPTPRSSVCCPARASRRRCRTSPICWMWGGACCGPSRRRGFWCPPRRHPPNCRGYPGPPACRPQGPARRRAAAGGIRPGGV